MSKDWKTAVGVTAGVVGVAALGGVCAYLLLKEDELEFSSRNQHISSRPMTIQVQIPVEQVGLVIGRGGENIKEIQKKTNTRIHMKDELATDTIRVASITGLPDDAKLAEILIYQVIANQPKLETVEIHVRAIFIGRIIGKNGETIHSIQDRSRCKIKIESRQTDDVGDRKISLKGTSEQIKIACGIIEDIVKEEVDFREQIKESAESRSFRSSRRPRQRQNNDKQPLFLTSDSHIEEEESGQNFVKPKSQTEELNAVNENYVVEAYVSFIRDPGFFFIQKVGPGSIALDKLVQDMSLYYDQDYNKVNIVEKISEGDFVASQYTLDGCWYRGKIVKVIIDHYDESKIEVDVHYVDFGDTERKPLSSVFELPDKFFKLKFQAIAACMANLKPAKNNEWSMEAIDDFESLTHAAQWKPLLAKVVTFTETEEEIIGDHKINSIACLNLVDTNTEEDVDIAKEMIEREHAI